VLAGLVRSDFVIRLEFDAIYYVKIRLNNAIVFLILRQRHSMLLNWGIILLTQGFNLFMTK
jgi:hypothetical protein